MQALEDCVLPPTWRLGNLETQKLGNSESQILGNSETQKSPPPPKKHIIMTDFLTITNLKSIFCLELWKSLLPKKQCMKMFPERKKAILLELETPPLPPKKVFFGNKNSKYMTGFESVLLCASVERFSVSRMQDFFGGRAREGNGGGRIIKWTTTLCLIDPV